MKKRFYATDAILWCLVAACTVLGASLALVRPIYLIPAGVVMLLAAALIWWNLRSLRKALAGLLRGKAYAESDTQLSFASLSLPVLVLSGNSILWYNDAFGEDVLQGSDVCFATVDKILPGFDTKQAVEKCGFNFEMGGERYTVYGSLVSPKSGLFVAYFVNNTQLKRQAGEYHATRPSVMMIALDTYDEIIKELKESERARISGEIELVLEQFIGATTGFLRRVSASKYIAVIEERHMQAIIKSRFSVLDTVRNIGEEGGLATLSIGVGRLGETLHECEKMADQALDMALGRGGDQAAVKSNQGFEFYGGVSRSVEKRSKVRSRIIATALKDLISQSDNVLIQGHKISDLDSVGAASGIWRICQMCGKPAAILLDEKQTLAQNLVDTLRSDGCEFIRPDGVENTVGERTLVVVVDTHLSYLLENEAVYQQAKNVVVIDHHRRCVGYIENAVVFYHEPSASSASELVAELLQYTECEKDRRLTPVGAEALLAGMVLDTRDFTIHTGVRTFEAAAYLRRMGAQTAEVKRLFNSSFESYAYKAHLVTQAEIYMGCALSLVEHLPAELSVIIPQAANDLLTIHGIDASFVAVDTGSKINISARSMGSVNVQVIMEKLGGGGHLTMAGTQMKDVTLEQAKTQLIDAITEYRENANNRRDG